MDLANMVPKSSGNHKTYIFRLSTELRAMIMKRLLPYYSINRAKTHSRWYSGSLSIAYTCKTMYAEAMAILYGTNLFIFRPLPYKFYFTPNWNSEVDDDHSSLPMAWFPPALFRQIRHFHITTNDLDLNLNWEVLTHYRKAFRALGLRLQAQPSIGSLMFDFRGRTNSKQGRMEKVLNEFLEVRGVGTVEVNWADKDVGNMIKMLLESGGTSKES